MSLKLRLLLIALVLPMLLMVAVTAITLPLHRGDQEARVADRMETAVALVAPSLVAALEDGDASRLAAYADRLLAIEEVRALAIINGAGERLLELGRLRPIADEAGADGVSDGLRRHGEGHWRLHTGLAEGGGARLVLDIDGGGLLLAHYRQVGVAGVLLVLAALLLGATTTATCRRLQRPLEEADAALARLQRGEPHAPLAALPPELPPLDERINALAGRLQEAREEMQRQVAQATVELEESMETVEVQNMQLDLAHRRALEANRVKSEFLANMSHEIRTPLNGIIGFCRLLGRSSLDARQREWLGHVNRACGNLLMLVNDVLDYSKLEAGRLELERLPVDMVELVDEVLALQAPTAQQKGLELVGMVYDDVPAGLQGDPLRIRQLLTNLVGNAVKFTERGEVVVRVMVEECEAGRVTLRVSVADTGIGLSAEHRRRLFEAFRQGDPSHSREFGGTGLGLSICRQLVEQMGGEIGVESEPGRGSTFAFTLPLAGDAATERPPELHLAGETVLLEEPHPTTRRALKHLLKRWGARPVVPGEASADAPPRLLVASLGDAPRHREPLERWRRRLAALPCPALLLCNTSPLELPELPLPRGGEVLVKPLTRRTFGEAVARALGSHHGGQAGDAAPEAMPARRRLLAVDDNRANRELLGALLAGPGVEVTLAASGEEALSLARQARFDLVLMDIRMPGMDGIAATRALRHLGPEWSHTPIVAVTAHALEVERRRLLASGLDDVITKPLDAERLATLMARHLGDRGEASAPMASPEPASHGNDLPTVDLALGTRLAGGDEAFAHRLLGQLADSLTESEAAIRQAYRERDHEALLDAIHALNGACRYCGAPRLALLVETMETRLRSRGREAMAPLMAPLFEAMAALRRWDADHPAEVGGEAQPSSTTKATANSSSSDNDR
ncbi:ATP-binding protein [Halomonas sp.]|uniref:ATP-binding protein n=1 Tax=Halomonas sp. TaxID=1486246 RepID=UPI003D0CF51B